MSSACDQYEERTYGPGHLGRKFAEQIPGREGSEPNRGSLACVGNIVEAARKIGIAGESTRSRSHKIRERKSVV